MELLDDDGLEALTMRRLAQRLDSSPMALYRHIRDREDLLLACLDEVAGELGVAARPAPARERLLVIFHGVHDILGRHRWVAPILAGGEYASPRAVSIVNEVITALQDAGLAHRDAVLGYVALWQYTLGHLMSDHTRTDSPTSQHRMLVEQAVAEFPALVTAMATAGDLGADDRFDWGLAALVDGVLLR